MGIIQKSKMSGPIPLLNVTTVPSCLETSAFGEFTIDATVKDPEVTFRLISDDGFVFHEMKLTRSQLTPRGK